MGLKCPHLEAVALAYIQWDYRSRLQQPYPEDLRAKEVTVSTIAEHLDAPLLTIEANLAFRQQCLNVYKGTTRPLSGGYVGHFSAFTA